MNMDKVEDKTVDAIDVWKDMRVIAGMMSQLQSLDNHLSGGSHRGGWKLGLGASAPRQSFGISGAVMGYLLSENCLESGASVSVSEWKSPALEPEVAVHIKGTLTADMMDEALLSAIGGIGPAIEMIDLDPSVSGLQNVLAENIFQRNVVLGHSVSDWNVFGSEGCAAHISVDDVIVESIDDPTRLTGGVLSNIRHAVRYLDAFGRALTAGNVLIMGSIVLAMRVQPGQRVTVSIDRLGSVSIETR